MELKPYMKYSTATIYAFIAEKMKMGLENSEIENEMCENFEFEKFEARKALINARRSIEGGNELPKR